MAAKGKDITVQVNGIAVCYDDLGIGDIPILFIHGFPFDKSSWQPQLDYLKSSHRIITYDLRGFGKTTAGIENASIDLFADDLIGLMNILQIDKAIVCGLSMGGYILLNAVNRYPERFEALVLSDTQCIADSSEGKEKRKKSIEQITAGGLTDFAEAFLKNAFCKESLDLKTEVVQKTRNIILSTSPETITGTLNALAQRRDMCSSLSNISVPSLILCGQEDVITPVAQSEYMFSRIKGSQFQIIDKSGHLSNLEQPEEFNKHVDKFISGLRK